MDILFFGAGASKALGYPLTKDLLPAVVERFKAGRLFPDDETKRKKLQVVLNALIPGLESGALPSFVDLLSLVDYCIANNITVFPRGGLFDLRQSRSVLESALLVVLEKFRPSQDMLGEFSKRISSSNRLGIITTNYDLVCEMAIAQALHQDTPIDLGFEWRDPDNGNLKARPTEPRVSLIKLHGSANWLRCPSCEQIYVSQGSVAILDSDTEENRYGSATECHCGYKPLRRLIVSPSIIRYLGEAQLRQLQLAAIHLLHQARRLFIVGYSLPTEDVTIRSIFIRGMQGATKGVKVFVYQIDHEALPRYAALFKEFSYSVNGFDGFLRDWN